MAEPPQNPPGANNGTRHLLAFVADCPAECPVCDYSLLGLTEPRCPECGAELELRVGSPRLHVGAWALAMTSFALALGFDGVVSIILVIALTTSLASTATPPPPPFAYVLTSFFLVLAASMATGLFLVARSRHRWTRRPTRKQWTHATAVFCAVGLLHAAIGVAWISRWA
ncbi:MAG: hypothetical protein ACF8R9_04415 [Phycisphaerales bacterium JB054]